jgi:hypothetical protein
MRVMQLMTGMRAMRMNRGVGVVRPRRAARAIGLSLLVALTVLGCRKRDAETSPAPDPNTPVPVEIENHFMGDVTIYLVRGSLRQRLGMVTALSTAEFTFPWRWLSQSGSSRLLAYPIAGARAQLSEPLIVQPGQWIKWTLEADLNRSSLAVY